MHTFLRKGMTLYIGASTWATFMDIDWRSEQRILFYMPPFTSRLVNFYPNERDKDSECSDCSSRVVLPKVLH